jgi:hypothetical protein
VNNEGAPMPAICDLLSQLNESGMMTVKEIENILDLAYRSGYPYIAGKIPDARQLRELFRHAPERSRVSIQSVILEYIAGGTGWNWWHIPKALDVNGDGQVNTDDALFCLVKSLRATAEAIELVHSSRQMEKGDADMLMVHMSDAINKLAIGRQVVSFLHERHQRALNPAHQKG